MIIYHRFAPLTTQLIFIKCLTVDPMMAASWSSSVTMVNQNIMSWSCIMSNEYTWIWICHHMCIFTCKIARIYANVFIYTENILTKFNYHHYHHCIYCTIVHFMFACLQLFCFFSFLFLFSLFFYYVYFLYHPKILLCYVMLCMPLFHRHSPLIDCRIVIRDIFSFSLESN